MKIIVCGGRKYAHQQRVFNALDDIHKETPISLIIHGNAIGADGFADDWAMLRGIKRLPFSADWKKLGPMAGPIRNQEMLNIGPDLVVAFPGGKGTADMVRRARAAKIKVIEIGE